MIWTFFIALILFFLAGCKKKERVHYTIADDVKQYGLFQKGSYWIYLNESTNQIDCTYVSQPPVFYTENLEGPEDEPLIDNIFVYGPIFSKLWLTGNYLFLENGFSIWAVFLSDVKVGNNRIIGSSKYQCLKMYDTLSINGIKFFQVLHTKYAALLLEGSIDSVINQFFIVPKIGIVKMRKACDQSDTTWSLLRYHVVQ